MCNVFVDIGLNAFDEGKFDGFNQGKNEGFNQGKDVGLRQGETQLARLIQILLRDGQINNISAVTKDEKVRHIFYEKYNL